LTRDGLAKSESGTTTVGGLTPEHIPVLAETLARWVSVPPNGVMVDATVGQGGHSRLLGASLADQGTLIGLDVDENSLQAAKARLQHLACKVILVRGNFAHIGHWIRQQGIETVDLILADLGFSSAQLADAETGLSFQSDMPLDMRMDKSFGTTAADIVNNVDEKALADLIFEYGEDRASRRIARFIVERRRERPITTTGQLATIVSKALYRPGHRPRQRIHPATRTFQALRIAVNHELDNLKQLLDQAPDLLRSKGYVAIISFHSLEDRAVKTNFRANQEAGLYTVLTKKPVVAASQEVSDHPRARSAKLRVAQRT
jgi:16S rRNA (cytosine1402-N4)-methyltransferase